MNLALSNTSRQLTILKARVPWKDQTLKNMIRSYCFDTEKDWDEGIHLLLFAVRESVQESLRFSPFELVFGHTVRGPLKLLKEKFLSDDDSSLNLLQYVSDFKNRLSKAFEAARSNLKSAQSKMKSHYDENALDRLARNNSEGMNDLYLSVCIFYGVGPILVFTLRERERESSRVSGELL